jgi:hypothetical protein
MKATKRFSYGLDFIVAYAYSKNLSTVESGVNNVFNRRNSKSYSSLDQPHLLTISFNYVLPAVGPMKKNNVTKTLLSGWTVGGILTYASGLPILSPSSNNGLSSVLFQSTYQNRVPGVSPYLKDLNCRCFDPNKDFVLNPAAWTDAAPGTWGAAGVPTGGFGFINVGLISTNNQNNALPAQRAGQIVTRFEF